jgi:hypothetical protein
MLRARMMRSAVKSGSVSCVGVLARRRCPVPHTCITLATAMGRVNCLRFLHRFIDGSARDRLVGIAVVHDRLACVQFLHSAGDTGGASDCAVAASLDRWEIIAWWNGLPARDGAPDGCGCPCGLGPHEIPPADAAGAAAT